MFQHEIITMAMLRIRTNFCQDPEPAFQIVRILPVPYIHGICTNFGSKIVKKVPNKKQCFGSESGSAFDGRLDPDQEILMKLKRREKTQSKYG
jgi:hypothetical protein